ncbi:outer membrane protein [Thermanaerovibrio velox DSM 12556]|uniref:Outer membrane protein n=1 Tax=Thermanaerovibrio velox DSM 12556 TaxID=926567 RepID=H0UPJ4_9BACT|nr:TolC family protein [Thermanaerovibrio velox]EHM09541.1 outer membrane protein [Thermanaerovibrio velox DSM 12556]
MGLMGSIEEQTTALKGLRALALSLALSLTLAVQAFGTQAVTLSDAVRSGIKHNQSVLSAEQDLRNAEALLGQARSAAMPSLNVQGSFTRSSEEGAERNDYGDLSLNQTVYAGGAITGALRQAEANLRKARHGLRHSKEKAAREAYEAFLNALLAQENLKTAEENRLYYEKAWETAEKRLQVGLSTRLEASRMKQNLREAQGAVETARGSLRSALITLARVMGVDPKEVTSVSGTLDIPAGWAVQGLEELEAAALKGRSDLAALREDIELQREAVKIAGASMRPSASLSGGYRFYQDKTGSSTKEGEWTATLNLTVPLVDFGRTDAKVLQEQSKLHKLLVSLKDMEDSVREELEKDLIALDTAVRNREIYAENLEIARENLRLAEVGYREGVNTQLDVISARRELNNGELRYKETLKALQGALKDIWFHCGALIERVVPDESFEGSRDGNGSR